MHNCIFIYETEKMEDKMKWAQNFERLQEIQKQLIWPPVSELAPRAFIPEVRL